MASRSPGGRTYARYDSMPALDSNPVGRELESLLKGSPIQQKHEQEAALALRDAEIERLKRALKAANGRAEDSQRNLSTIKEEFEAFKTVVKADRQDKKDSEVELVQLRRDTSRYRTELAAADRRRQQGANSEKLRAALEADMKSRGHNSAVTLLRQIMARMMRGELGMRIEVWRQSRQIDGEEAKMRQMMRTMGEAKRGTALRQLRQVFIRITKGLVAMRVDVWRTHAKDVDTDVGALKEYIIHLEHEIVKLREDLAFERLNVKNVDGVKMGLGLDF